MKENIDLSIDINTVLKSVYLKKSVLNLSLILGIGCTLTPLVFKQLDRESKTLLLAAGIIGNLTASLLPRDTKDEKLKAFWESQVSENFKRQLKHEVIHLSATQEIEEKNRLATFIDDDNKVPFYQKEYWANKFGVIPLIGSFFVRDNMEPKQEEVALEATPTFKPGNIQSVQYTAPTPEMDWIVELVKKSCLPVEKRSNQHFKVDGGSQSGKSTLVSAVIAFMSGFSGELQINLIDPKYPKTQWIIEPSFIGFEQVADGVETAIIELNNRKKLCLEAAKSKRSQPEFKRYLLIVDEWDSIWGNGKGYGNVIAKDAAQKIKGELQRYLKESAAYNMSLILVGQSPLSSDNGFSRSTLNSATRLVLGNEALKWVQDPGFPFKRISTALQDELEDWIGKGERVALIAPNIGGSPYVKPIPQIDLNKLFRLDTEKQDQSALTDTQKTYLVFKNWVNSQTTKPSAETILAYWQELTGEKLTPAGLQYLLEKLGIN